jgi:predicted RNA-binding protein YlqC (UPF0109 family)
MKELLYYIVKALVDHPEAISINEIEREGELVLELTVDPSDMGKVIGPPGKNCQGHSHTGQNGRCSRESSRFRGYSRVSQPNLDRAVASALPYLFIWGNTGNKNLFVKRYSPINCRLIFA